MRGILLLLLIACIIAGMSFTNSTTNKVDPVEVNCTYTIYKTNVTQQFWDELNSGHGYEVYIIVKLGSADDPVSAEPIDFLNQTEYLQLLNGLCVEGYYQSIVIDEIDGF